MIKPPCYNEETKTDCPDRTYGCHERCEKWSKYEKLRNEEYRKRLMESEARNAHFEHWDRINGNGGKRK